MDRVVFGCGPAVEDCFVIVEVVVVVEEDVA